MNDLREKYEDILAHDCIFAVGEGWHSLIKSLLRTIDCYVARGPLDGVFEIVQIKEKFGGLRVYSDHADDYIQGAITMAECMSNNVCEVCGAPGQNIIKTNWIKTRCSAHV